MRKRLFLAMTIAHNVSVRVLLVAALCLVFAGRPSTQAPSPADGPWAGWIRCQVTAQAQGYSDQQIHTWILSGEPPRVEGVFRVFPATWSVVGIGSLQRTSATSTVTAQWATNGQGPSAPIAVFTRGDGRLVFTLRHDQLRAQGGFTGYRFYTVDGKRQTPESLAAATFEYQFAPIDAATSNAVSGSSTVAAPPSNAFMPQPGSTGSVSCTWQFGVGAAAPQPPPQLQAQATPTPPAPGAAPPSIPPLNAGISAPTALPGGPPSTTPPVGFAPARADAGPAPTLSSGAVVPGREKVPSPVAVSPGGASSTSGNYLVTINGLQAGQNTLDDPLGFDGRGDEIYAAAFVRCYDRGTSKFMGYSRIKTTVYGDSNLSQRIQAGTQSPLGGIRTLDTIPNDLRVARVAPVSDTQFPLRVFAGTLTDGKDELVISPSVWESDFGNSEALVAWFADQNSASAQLFVNAGVLEQISNKAFSPLTLGAVSGAGLLSVLRLGDRPVGVVGSGVGTLAVPNTVVVLTREIVEAALSRAYTPRLLTATPGVVFDIPKPGILVIRFADGDFGVSGLIDRGGVYYMVLQVERLADGPVSTGREVEVRTDAAGLTAPETIVQPNGGCQEMSDQRRQELSQQRDEAIERKFQEQLQRDRETIRKF